MTLNVPHTPHAEQPLTELSSIMWMRKQTDTVVIISGCISALAAGQNQKRFHISLFYGDFHFNQYMSLIIRAALTYGQTSNECNFSASAWLVIFKRTSAQTQLCLFSTPKESTCILYCNISERTLVTFELSALPGPQIVLNSKLWIFYTGCKPRLYFPFCAAT